MSRWIDADALHKAYIELRNFKQDPQSGDWISLRAVPLTTVIRMLNDLPSIELIRCKDCIHWQLLTSPFGLCVWNEDNKRQMEETGFCSCGVKR